MRLSRHRFEVSAGGAALYPTYRRLAIANGVPRTDPVLRNCRDDGQMGGC